jgi:WD40 repeat protein
MGGGVVRFHDVGTGAERAALKGHEGIVWSVAFSSDGKTLASCAGDETVKIRDVSGLLASRPSK